MQTLLDLELLRTFVLVVRTGELKQAAKAIYRSQAAVSMQIKRLEEQLGTRLMERNNRGIHLTSAGKTLFSYSEQFLKLNNATLSALAPKDLSGQLRFGIPTDYAQDFLEVFMPILTQELPNLEACIVCDRSRNLRKKIDDGTLDIAIVSGENNHASEALLWSERLLWLAPTTARLEDKAWLPIALYEDNCIIRDLSVEALNNLDIPYKQVFSSLILDNIATAVYSGFALALLPESFFNPNKARILANNFLSSNLVININMIHSTQVETQVLQRITECLQIAATLQQQKNHATKTDSIP